MESKESQFIELPNFSHGLRIGNYYEYFHEESSSYHKVDADFIKTQFEYDTNPDDDKFIRGWWAGPVLLTPEILLKAGAVNKYGNVFFIGKLKFSYEISELSQFVRFHYSGKVTYLQYLHELQNLYYSICRNELEITLN